MQFLLDFVVAIQNCRHSVYFILYSYHKILTTIKSNLLLLVILDK